MYSLVTQRKLDLTGLPLYPPKHALKSGFYMSYVTHKYNSKLIKFISSAHVEMEKMIPLCSAQQNIRNALL